MSKPNSNKRLLLLCLRLQRLFEEDPLACILGTPDSNRKMNMFPPQHTGTILMRRERLIEEVTGRAISRILKTAPVPDMLDIAAAL